MSLPSLQETIDFLRLYYHDYGYAIVFFGAWLENIVLVSLVWPGGVVVLLGAIYARLGELSFGLTIILAWLGSLLGTFVNYLIGRYSSTVTAHRIAPALAGLLERLPLIRRLVRRVWPQATGAEAQFVRDSVRQGMTRTSDELNRRGAALLFASQAIGHARCVASLAAGASGYPFGRFVLIEAAGTLVSTLVIGGLGYLIGENFALINQLIGRLSVALLLLIGALWLLRRRLTRTGAGLLRWRRRVSTG